MTLVTFKKRGNEAKLAARVEVPAVPRVGEYVSVGYRGISFDGDVYEVAHIVEDTGTRIDVILK